MRVLVIGQTWEQVFMGHGELGATTYTIPIDLDTIDYVTLDPWIRDATVRGKATLYGDTITVEKTIPVFGRMDVDESTLRDDDTAWSIGWGN